jgi:hypothetical protein
MIQGTVKSNKVHFSSPLNNPLIAGDMGYYSSELIHKIINKKLACSHIEKMIC